MSKPFLVIQLRTEDTIADDELAAIRRYGRLDESEVVRLRAEQSGVPDLDLADYAGIIVGGSPFDISTHAGDKSDAQRRVEADFERLLSEVHRLDFPFLGCCSGNGLLGSYCGATISKKYGEPVGGITVTVTDDGQKDPLLRGLPVQFRVLVGHKEACDDVPPGAVLLVKGESCLVQMFRLGANLYATQFHPEGDPEGFAARIDAYRHHGYFPPDDASLLIKQLKDKRVPYSNEILKRFVERYRR